MGTTYPPPRSLTPAEEAWACDVVTKSEWHPKDRVDACLRAL